MGAGRAAERKTKAGGAPERETKARKDTGLRMWREPQNVIGVNEEAQPMMKEGEEQ